MNTKKHKIRKSISGRFRVTKKGKVLRRQGFNRHLKKTKSQKRLRSLKQIVKVEGPMAKKLRRYLA